MTAWRDKFRQAKFRNVEFFVPSAEHSGGRRAVVHIFPGRETGYTEDLGKTPRHFSVEGYVLGADYFGARNDLINALEAPGVGKLVHPYYGEIDVQAGDYTVREMQDEGGVARFTMSFHDAGSVAFPKSAANTGAVVYTKKSVTLSSAKAAFSTAYKIAQAAYAQVQNARKTADAVFAAVEIARRVVGSVAEFERMLDNVKGLGIQLVLDVENLAKEIEQVLDYGTSREDAVAGGETDAVRQMGELLEFIDGIADTAPAALSPSDPSPEIMLLAQRVAIGSAAGMLTVVPFSSATEAREIGEALLARLDALAENTTSDDVFAALADLRAAVVADINRRALSLPDLVEFTPAGDVTSLALSWRLYGNLRGEGDLIARNQIQNPAVISGGVVLEVLTDAG